MKDAKTLLLEFLAAVTRGQDAAALFAEDGALELPFLQSLAIPWRHRGRQAMRLLIKATGCAPRPPAESSGGASNEISPSWP